MSTDHAGRWSSERQTLGVRKELFDAVLAASQGGPPLSSAHWAEAARTTITALCEANEQIQQLRARLTMIRDAAKDGASLTWIRAVADEGLRGEPLSALEVADG